MIYEFYEYIYYRMEDTLDETGFLRQIKRYSYKLNLMIR